VSRKQTTAAVPAAVPPMLSSSSAPFDDEAYIFEIKWDGVRALTAVARSGCRVWGRELVNYTGRYPELDALCSRLPPGTILDGELVVIRNGRPDFHALMARHSRRPSPSLPFFAEAVRYVVFDMLYLRGRSLMDRPLHYRRQVLSKNLPELPMVSLCDGMVGAGTAFFRSAIVAGHEGVVAKRLSSPYVPNQRGKAWRKIKQKFDLPCVVIGYRLQGRELRDLAMATLVDGKPAYAGVVELGIHHAQELLDRLESARLSDPAIGCPLHARWVKPQLFCMVRCCGWRPNGVWREAVVLSWNT